MACPSVPQHGRMTIDKGAESAAEGSRRAQVFQAAEVASSLMRRAGEQHHAGWTHDMEAIPPNRRSSTVGSGGGGLPDSGNIPG